MNKKQYVTFEVAKLLKDKGFDWEVRSLYGEEGDMGFSSWSNNYNTQDDLVSAPTQQMACRWLREEKGFYVYAVYGDYPTENKEYWVPELGSLKDFMVNPDFYQEYDSPEDAIEAALQYVLTNLI